VRTRQSTNKALNGRFIRRDKSLIARRLCLLAAIILQWVSPPTFALEFEPTALEWSTWPAYCRARFVVSAAGRKSAYANSVSSSEVSKWESRIKPVWAGFHHYCAAVHVFSRAQKQKSPQMVEHDFRRVSTETTYALARSSQSHPLYSTMLTLRGRAFFELGQMGRAEDDFRLAVRLHPDDPNAYAAWGLLLRRSGDRAEARSVLERGIEGTKGGTAELHYLLGIILTELKDYEPALEHAKLAYQMGYPLLGLKHKLQKSGHWSK
jgi:tetratricopeptide (TPR) repeat protein